jgi:hypothetical protein
MALLEEDFTSHLAPRSGVWFNKIGIGWGVIASFYFSICFFKPMKL